MKRNLLLLKVSHIINQLNIVICSSKDLAYLFKIAYKWAKKNAYTDFIIRLLFILTHISWGFYLEDKFYYAAFVWMVLCNLSLSLFIYSGTKIVVSAVVCWLWSWWVIWWMCSSDCLKDLWDISDEEQEEDSESQIEQESIQDRNRRRRR